MDTTAVRPWPPPFAAAVDLPVTSAPCAEAPPWTRHGHGTGRANREEIQPEESTMKLSARNVLAGTVLAVKRGATTAHVRPQLPGGAIVTASITNEAVDELGLKQGDQASARIRRAAAPARSGRQVRQPRHPPTRRPLVEPARSGRCRRPFGTAEPQHHHRRQRAWAVGGPRPQLLRGAAPGTGVL